jgi:alcohol dehydrogenase class IV
MQFEFATATRILFGNGTIKAVGSIAKDFGRLAMVVGGKNPDRIEPLLEQLKKQGIEFVTFQVSGREPTTNLALEGVKLARQQKCELVIGMGGGSVIDTGKVIAALITNQDNLMNYLEVIGLGKKLTNPSAPYIAIPTTSGTGAEVTRNAVLKSPEHQVKVSMRSPLMLPRMALVDPELTYSMPPAVTASTGLDALTQLMEAFVSKKSNPLTDGICREGIHRAARSLRRAFENGSEKAAREDMSLASLFSGLALANAGLGAVHGFAGPLGGMFPAPHGVICARLLPFVMETNISALKNRIPNSPALAQFDEIAQILTGNISAKAEDGLEWIVSLCEILKVPSLSEFGLKEEDFQEVIEKSKNASSMKGNPIQLSGEELAGILRKAL